MIDNEHDFFSGARFRRDHREQAEELKEAAEDAINRREFRRNRELKFKEEFGEELGTVALAYARRDNAYGDIFIEESYVPIEEASKRYAKGIIEGLSQQPEEQREEWLATFFEKLDILEPPKGR